MREYKFRGKRIDNGEWIYGSLLDGDIIVAGPVDVDGEYIGVGEWSTVDPETVEEYTGLKDKNGKDIYKGDIFPPTERTNGEVTIVCYDSKQCRYKAVPLGLYKANAGNGGWTGFDLNPFSEVIGNVIDNPELLRGG